MLAASGGKLFVPAHMLLHTLFFDRNNTTFFHFCVGNPCTNSNYILLWELRFFSQWYASTVQVLKWPASTRSIYYKGQLARPFLVSWCSSCPGPRLRSMKANTFEHPAFCTSFLFAELGFVGTTWLAISIHGFNINGLAL